MNKILRVLAGIGILLVIPFAANALPENFTVTVTLQGVTRVVAVEKVDAETLKKVLDDSLWEAISAWAFTIGADLDVSPSVTIPEQKVIVRNDQSGQVTVITFVAPLGEAEEKKFVVGGYIAKGEKNLSGAYHGSATMQAIFQ